MSSIFLKIIEIEKEVDLSRETLIIHGDFSVHKLYDLIKGNREEMLDNLDKMGFYDEEHGQEDFKRMLDSISENEEVSEDEFKSIFYPNDPDYCELLDQPREDEISEKTMGVIENFFKHVFKMEDMKLGYF
jgi:hypothetical protein